MRKKLSIISLLLFMALISHSYAADINPINFDSLADKDSLDNKCKTKSDDYLNNFYLNALHMVRKHLSGRKYQLIIIRLKHVLCIAVYN
jgi:hypothetical protein